MAISLAANLRQNLLALQQNSASQSLTQGRLATGKKVNSALDNATSFFAAQNLNSRADNISGIMDNLSNGIQTITQANNGITSMIKVLQNLKSTVSQARDDATVNYGAAYQGTGTTNASTATNNAITIGGTSISTWDTAAGAAMTTDQIVTAINNDATLNGSVKATNVGGKLKLQNTTTAAIATTGITAAGVTGLATDNTVSLAAAPAISDTRKSLISSFNTSLGEFNSLGSDANYKGVNLLNGDTLNLKFSDDSSSSLAINLKKADGTAFGKVNSASVSVNAADVATFSSNDKLDTLSNTIDTAISSLQSLASQLGNSLTLTQNRSDFLNQSKTTFKTGADTLVNADTNEEATNLLTLQTQQSLAQNSLSLANQANQGVMRLFG